MVTTAVLRQRQHSHTCTTLPHSPHTSASIKQANCTCDDQNLLRSAAARFIKSILQNCAYNAMVYPAAQQSHITCMFAGINVGVCKHSMLQTVLLQSTGLTSIASSPHTTSLMRRLPARNVQRVHSAMLNPQHFTTCKRMPGYCRLNAHRNCNHAPRSSYTPQFNTRIAPILLLSSTT